ncbi:hypothetical protein ECE50_017475 [Chitinophaga sp. Mgbs1]|uniref:Uncharacterized protein n=1 Tax=Chitinophaga solisilvae TaxID=1233460 RepID=A0A9Q5D2Q6_9BACT|nr:hypothetical protein [Chitinophaga solisilvae]
MKTFKMPKAPIYLLVFLIACNTKQSISSSKEKLTHLWDNHYTLHTESGETMNNINVIYDYELVVSNDSATFLLDGIQAAFKDKCYISETKDTLTGYFAYDIDGYETSHNQISPLFKVFKSDNHYYIISEIIAPTYSNKIWRLKTSSPPDTTTTQKNQ